MQKQPMCDNKGDKLQSEYDRFYAHISVNLCTTYVSAYCTPVITRIFYRVTIFFNPILLLPVQNGCLYMLRGNLSTALEKKIKLINIQRRATVSVLELWKALKRGIMQNIIGEAKGFSILVRNDKSKDKSNHSIQSFEQSTWICPSN